MNQLTNFTFQIQAQETEMSSYIVFALITAFIGLACWWIKRQLERNDKNNEKNFSELSAGMNNLRDDITSVKLEVTGSYLKSTRFEEHEKENRDSFQRVHDRIDKDKL